VKRKIIIGSRGSDLALWQANHVLNQVKGLGLEAELKIITTQGDAIQHLSFDKLEGKGFFTKEIEDALLKKEIDLAVHSHKDLPTTSPDGLMIAAVSEREDPSDLLLVRKECVDNTIKLSVRKNATIGTSSARRKSQLLAFRNDIQLVDLRGNVPTRIQKLRDKKYDAIMLAAAGVERLKIDLSEFVCIKLDPKEFIPAPAQGVLGLQIRENDHELFQYIQKLNNEYVKNIIDIERKVLNLFDGGCQLPLGVYCIYEDNKYKVWAAKAQAWDKAPKRIYYENKNHEGTALKVVELLKSNQPKKVLITKSLDSNSFFKNTLEANGYQVEGVSFIEPRMVNYTSVPKTDWMFFSSANAVKYFFTQNPILDSHVKFGAVGKTTEEELNKHHKAVDFVGKHVDISKTGQEFKNLIGSKTVLFPLAKGSMRTIQQQFDDISKVIDLVVYETELKKQLVKESFEVLVFTSPSNVQAFFESNKIQANQSAVAIGRSTEKKLMEYGVKKCVVPSTLSEIGLAEAVFGL
jgi:hydroxymethylbilane synthase